MNATQSFYFGIASGIASSVLVFVGRHLLGQLFSLLTGFFSRRVRGTWSTRFRKNNEDFEESAELYQLFHSVWGEINYPNKGRKYVFRGTLRSGVLVATFEVKGEPSTVDRGAFTLILNPIGSVTTMTGKYSWTDDDTQVPESDYYEWTKKK